jgi:hypothetical protein
MLSCPKLVGRSPLLCCAVLYCPAITSAVLCCEIAIINILLTCSIFLCFILNLLILNCFSLLRRMKGGSAQFHVEEEDILRYRRVKMSWTTIALKLETTTKTLLKWRKCHGYQVDVTFLIAYYYTRKIE